MNSFIFKLFQFFGILPFKIKRQNVSFSRLSYIWSIFITLFFIYVSILRCTYRHRVNDDHSIFITLINYEPFLGLTEIIFSTFPIYLSSRSLLRYTQILLSLKLSLNNTNKKLLLVLILTIFQSGVLITLLFVVYYPLCERNEKIIAIVDLIQSIFRVSHLFHLFVAFHRMLEHLKVVEKNLRNAKLETIFDESCKVLKAYDELRKFYEFFVLLTSLQVFYDTLTGVKKLEDFLIDYDESGVNKAAAFTVFWWLFHVPQLISVLHEGHLLHDKVTNLILFLS